MSPSGSAPVMAKCLVVAESLALMVSVAQSPIAELLATHPVLLAKLVNDLQSALVHPIRKRRLAESEMGREPVRGFKVHNLEYVA
jgi:hypothetical protein